MTHGICFCCKVFVYFTIYDMRVIAAFQARIRERVFIR